MNALALFKDTFSKYPVQLNTLVFLVFLTGLLELAAVITVAPVIDIIFNPDLKKVSSVTLKIIEAFNAVGIAVGFYSLIAAFFSITLLCAGLKIWIAYMIFKIRFILTQDILHEAIDTFFKARWYFFSSNKQGKLYNAFMSEVGKIAGGVRLFGEIFRDILFIVFYFLLAFYISLEITSIVLVMSILFSIPFFMSSRITAKLAKKNLSMVNRRSTVIVESFSLSKIILGFGKKDDTIKSLLSVFKEHYKVSIKLETLYLAVPLLYYPASIIIVLVSILLSQKFKTPVSEAAVVLFAIYRALPLIGKVATHKHGIEKILPSYAMVNHLKLQAREMEMSSGKRIFKGLYKGIAIEKVSFAYPGHEPVLKDININISTGRMVAIVGESGAGKSTLIDLIMGLNEPSSGKIKFDGTPLKDFEINSYRKRIGYVPQECVLFNMTIADNLRWAKDGATDDDIKKSCALANADKFIKEFPDGYNTFVGDRGVRLSGGQSQRVALARAIIRKPDLLVLDEATSALDSQSERLIQQSIEKIAKKTTVVVIAHRLSTIIHSDHIYVLSKGRIVEEGTYSQLTTMNGFFKRMIEAQELNGEKLAVEKKEAAV